MRYKKVFLAAAIGGIFVLGGIAGVGLPKAAPLVLELVNGGIRPTDKITIAAYRSAPEQRAQFFSSEASAPLIVDLHQWSEDEGGYAGNDEPLDKLVKAKGWNFIRPALAGPNRNPKACCSAAVIDGVAAAIEYAKAKGHVDTRLIYVVGVSGGGYTTLCAAASGKISARAYYAWASITDLEAWYNSHKADRYGSDVMQCTGSNGSLNIAEAHRRSPYYMPLSQKPVHIFAGVHDGFTGSVLSSQSMKMFNRYAVAYDPRQSVAPQELERLLEARVGPDTLTKSAIGGRNIHLERHAGPASLVVFEGGHEMLARPMVDQIAADVATVTVDADTQLR